MVSSRNSSDDGKRRRRPATTPEDREHQMINLALDQAELQLREGTAATPVVVLYLKLATQRSKLEEMALQADIELRRKKIEQIENEADMKQLTEDAIRAMREYQGHDEEQIDDY